MPFNWDLNHPPPAQEIIALDPTHEGPHTVMETPAMNRLSNVPAYLPWGRLEIEENYGRNVRRAYERNGDIRFERAREELFTNTMLRLGWSNSRVLAGNNNASLENNKESKKGNQNFEQGGSQPMPEPKEITFTCPICMDTLVEETATKCGHIFCKACIHYALGRQGKCPTCRRKIRIRDTFRVYLPKANQN